MDDYALDSSEAKYKTEAKYKIFCKIGVIFYNCNFNIIGCHLHGTMYNIYVNISLLSL